MASNRKRQREIQQNTDRIGNNFDYFRFLAANKEALDGNADIGTTSITKKRKASSPPTVDTFKINSTASYLNSDVKQTPPGKRIRRALSRGLSLRRVSNKSAQPSGSTFNQPFSANRTPSKFGLNSLRDKSNIPFDQKYKSKDDSGLDLTLSKKDPWGTLRYNLRSKISGTIMRQKMKGQQDYSSLFTVNSDFLRFLATSSMKNQPKFEDHDLQQKIDREIKMRDGTAKLLAASKHPSQMLEAAKTLLVSNTRMMAYMSELQKRKTDEVMKKNICTSLQNQAACKGRIAVSDLRIPLMWKDVDHFKNKGDHRRYALFCLLRIGTEIYDTSLLKEVDRSLTDLSFDDYLVFQNIGHDFECKLEVYCHKVYDDLTIASTPKKIKKKLNNLSNTVGKSVGRRLSGLKDDGDCFGNMLIGPKFELIAQGTMRLSDAKEDTGTFDLAIEDIDETGHELPLFGAYCCKIAAQPACIVEDQISGYLHLQQINENDETVDAESKWDELWCVLKNLELTCWRSEDEVNMEDTPILTIPITKESQICDADPGSMTRPHTFHIITMQDNEQFQHTLSATDSDNLSKWFNGFQQHLLDQAMWKQACETPMEIQSPSTTKLPGFTRKTSLYESTSIKDSPIAATLLRHKVQVTPYSQTLKKYKPITHNEPPIPLDLNDTEKNSIQTEI